MPCFVASCAVVSSPRSASSATRALNSAEYRVRLPVIGSVLFSGRTKLNDLSEIRGPPQLHAREQHEALVAARARVDTKQGRQLYAQRQGVEGTISQGVRRFGMRQARYRGLAKTGLQNMATAAALNLDRLAAWLAKRPLAPTRVLRFAAMAA